VEMEAAPFKKFASLRDAWAVEDSYVSPGPIQFCGPTADDTNFTLKLECGAPVNI
jgi:pyrophosphate--fructose-6-phosphate 1-phosphotransferase